MSRTGRPITESEESFTAWVIELALRTGWRATHFRAAWSKRGYRTPVQGHKGFMDVVLARDGVVLIRELKQDGGRLTPDQKAWLEALGDLAGVWRPRDKDEIIATLTAPRTSRGAAWAAREQPDA